MGVVFALATPAGQSPICVFRVTGAGCLDSLQKILDTRVDKARMFYKRNLFWEGLFIDSVGVVFFESPSSFTGEDSFEIYAHGSLPIMSQLVSVFEGCGFAEAAPGEFSFRAFENNKISLVEAESINDLIRCGSKNEASAISSVFSGQFESQIESLSERIDVLRVLVEGAIDFSDEDEDFDSLLSSVLPKLSLLLDDLVAFFNGFAFREEVFTRKKVVLVGPPNVGKSSMFNRLLGQERSIVSNAPGTTRDFISSGFLAEGVSFDLVDTAGMHTTKNEVESSGISFTKKELENADGAVIVVDHRTLNELDELRETVVLYGVKSVLVVLNKADLGIQKKFPGLSVSTLTGENFFKLRRRLVDLVSDQSLDKNQTFMVRKRCSSLFDSCIGHLKDAQNKLGGSEFSEVADIVAEDLRLCRASLDEVVGKKLPDDVLGEIFSTFCIGK